MKRVLAVVVAALVLTGCGSDVGKNTDPRKGRVVTEDSNCLWGKCRYSWNICIGPDLIVHIDGTDERTVKAAPECEATS